MDPFESTAWRIAAEDGFASAKVVARAQGTKSCGTPWVKKRVAEAMQSMFHGVSQYLAVTGNEVGDSVRDKPFIACRGRRHGQRPLSGTCASSARWFP